MSTTKKEIQMRRQMFDYWKNAGKNKKGNQMLVQDIARRFSIPEAVVEKYIAEWSAGKTG